jgi:hypothetical protein
MLMDARPHPFSPFAVSSVATYVKLSSIPDLVTPIKPDRSCDLLILLQPHLAKVSSLGSGGTPLDGLEQDINIPSQDERRR